MEKKVIIYLHGYGSSGESSTVKHLRKIMTKYDVLAPDIPVNPVEALPFLKDYCEKYHPDLVIGTSMGAMYAMQMHNYNRICVNPALRMSELTDILKPGTFKYFQPTQDGKTHFTVQDGKTHFTVTEDIIQQFRDMEAHMFDGVNSSNRLFCWGFFGDEDTTVNWREEFEQHFAPNVQMFHGGHRMNNKVLDEVIVPFVEDLLECCNSRYKKGDWVRFKSEEPDIYLNRYTDGVTDVYKDKYIGIIKDVHTVFKGIYNYTIITIPLQFICSLTFENDIIEKLTNEQLRNENLGFLELPDGINEVPACMCEHWRVLEYVVLPSTIKTIGICAFNGCTLLQEIKLPDSIEHIEDGAFRFCESLKKVCLPSNLNVLSPELFYGSGIESIEIHQNIKEIGYWAFWACKHLKRLIIPESVTRIGHGIVTAHEGFEGIECHAKGYHVENDALIDDERQELLCCWTRQKNYVVPECVKRIADISGNEFLETITVKQPIELSTYDVFASDINLRYVDFQGGATGIYESTFWNCPKLENK